MRPLPFTLQELRYLVAVADYQHFGKAANACNVTQPALSIQLKKLEDMLDVQLIERTNRSARLTPDGEKIVKKVRHILEESQNILDMIQKGSKPFEGPLNIGIIPTIAQYYLPEILSPIMNKFHNIELFLTEDKTENLLQALQDGKLDCLILALPTTLINADAIEIEEESFVFTALKNNPLIEKGIIEEGDLINEKLLLLEEGHCLRDHILQSCKSFGAKNKNKKYATSLETIKQMVAAGTGSTLLPEKAAKVLPKGVTSIPFKAPKPKRTIALVYRKNSARREEFAILAQVMRDK